MDYTQLNNAYKAINNWYLKKTKVLNIRTRPFNTKKIFSKIIIKALNENKSILYVLCGSSNKNLSKIKDEYMNRFLEGYNSKLDNNHIDFIYISSIIEVVEQYDLVIFDDITVFSEVYKEDIRDAIEQVYWRSVKIIIYSCEKVFPIGENLEVINLKSNIPTTEPRVISTRLKLEEDIPLILYEYLMWLKENKKVTVIVTPTEEKMNKVYSHYYKILKLQNIRVVKYAKGQKYSFLENILEGCTDTLFIITNNVSNYIKEIDNLNLVLLFSDHKFYSYKKLVYLCATINKSSSSVNEAIFVSNDNSEEMDSAKDILRGFNKSLWEKR